MDADKIIQDLNRKFAAPLPEFYKRRIVVWYDEDREFEDQIDSLTITGAKILKLTGSNNFYAKKLLAVDDPTSSYLVYCPLSYEAEEDDWLLDVELYGEEFRADQISMWMDEMQIPETPALRKAFKMYRKFFKAQGRRNKVVAQGTTPTKPAQLQMAIMTALANIKEPKPAQIMKAVLQAGLDMEKNAIWQEFVSYDIAEAFWVMVGQGTGYKDPDADLRHLAAHLLLTAATRTLRQDAFSGLESLISTPHQAYCFDFVSDWIHSEDSRDICAVAEYVESELKLPQRFMKLQVLDLIETEMFPCVNEVILVKLMTDIGNHSIDVDLITKTVEKRRTCVWYDSVKNYYEGILQVAMMQAFFKEHASGFHTVEPHKVWQEYTKEYYRMDTYYRQFHMRYAESLKSYHEELTDRFSLVKDQVEGLYINWFLGQLGTNWSDVCAANLHDHGRILEVPQQVDFYRSKVASSDAKVYVIISDAMRYEVAASLTEQLQRETQAKVSLTGVQGVFPTVTKFGMAALLPHKKLSVELKTGKTERLAVLADGQSTEAGNRDKLLKGADIHSVALQYKNIIGMKRAERQALIKGMNVVYIYHDTIDAAGHDEKDVFGACEETIEELKNMVRIIANEWGGAYILITSDHGFLYTYSPLTEEDKVDLDSHPDEVFELGRRYAIVQKTYSSNYLMPVEFIAGDNPHMIGYTPREGIRIKMKGGGLNFVHGGISLQEMVVPVIEYHFLRNQSSEYRKNRSKYDTKPVEIALLSANRKITNMIFSLSFYQKEPVSYNREKATYQLYFTDSTGKPVSDTATIIADKTSDNGQERTFRCSFNLKQLKYSNTEQYYLVITDENGMIVSREEFQIDIAFAVDEFDFFS